MLPGPPFLHGSVKTRASHRQSRHFTELSPQLLPCSLFLFQALPLFLRISLPSPLLNKDHYITKISAWKEMSVFTEHRASFYLSGLDLQLSPTGQALSRPLPFIMNNTTGFPQELIFWGSLSIRTSNLTALDLKCYLVSSWRLLCRLAWFNSWSQRLSSYINSKGYLLNLTEPWFPHLQNTGPNMHLIGLLWNINFLKHVQWLELVLLLRLVIQQQQLYFISYHLKLPQL